ncbi:glycosyltransferase family 2 protein [Phormidium sp. LEGE 05292]|uniref:glycosyltransferase family 2 protein n=1 Tax=[Phormidium] sp. LEGE 05292 TaxID=767427 RepID=UPI00187FD8B3|nr:glycosyltransferase [Phormidium sp. LEGE 05292]MBE9224359.1 glycosyltransferase family 2 protein [Phormidium sp. LEGE 05292]
MPSFPEKKFSNKIFSDSSDLAKSTLTISLIVPVLNGGENFRQCLQSVSKVAEKLSEIIVIDDGSTDDSGKLAAELGAKVITFPAPGGPARARNKGAEVARGDILFFIDADVTLTVETIDRLITAFSHSPNLDALIGSYDDSPGASNFLSQYKNLFHHYTHQTSSEEASTFWGACGAVRRDAFWAVGGFDERYRYPSVEDIELGYRLKQAGCRIKLDKTVQVKHLKDWRVVSLLRAEIFYRAIPWTELLWRDRQFSNDLNLKNSSRLSLILTYLLVICLMGGWWWSILCLVGLGVSLALLLLNLPVYRFFLQKRGILFTFGVIPWHWLYFFYGGLAFVIGTIRYHLYHRLKIH